MSVQRDIHGFLESVAKGSDSEWVAMTPEAVARQLGVERNRVNKTLFNLMTTGKIELQRAANGRSIIGFKVLAGPTAPGRPPRVSIRHRQTRPVMVQPGSARVHRSTLHTPTLDSYAQAKARFEQAKTDFGDLIEATFRENPYAEEGLLLRSRLDTIEGEWVERERRLETAERDLRYLRSKHQNELAADAIRAGSVVDSGD